ncbi:hypothetical protein EDB81DRAFT_785090 [Dactylonectria macrodidyma]|uniref:Uncharacterized protein n=1 Tax=Dactylonectria macrodidyma TaxID=307937 RepID=A0A9P9FHJ2_9HYPO|nr:hypothetical protein EDB81DRAFT_785090 [Dactylonectria macrodidyma]
MCLKRDKVHSDRGILALLLLILGAIESWKTLMLKQHIRALRMCSTNFLPPLKYVLSNSTLTQVLISIDGLDKYGGSKDDLEGLFALLQS